MYDWIPFLRAMGPALVAATKTFTAGHFPRRDLLFNLLSQGAINAWVSQLVQGEQMHYRTSTEYHGLQLTLGNGWSSPELPTATNNDSVRLVETETLVLSAQATVR